MERIDYELHIATNCGTNLSHKVRISFVTVKDGFRSVTARWTGVPGPPVKAYLSPHAHIQISHHPTLISWRRSWTDRSVYLLVFWYACRKQESFLKLFAWNIVFRFWKVLYVCIVFFVCFFFSILIDHFVLKFD